MSNKKSLKELAEKIKEYETEVAPGSETSNLGAFVYQYDYISAILEADEDVMIPADDYDMWIESYEDLAKEYAKQDER